MTEQMIEVTEEMLDDVAGGGGLSVDPNGNPDTVIGVDPNG